MHTLLVEIRANKRNEFRKTCHTCQCGGILGTTVGSSEPYIFTGTWSNTKNEDGDYPVTLGDDYSWTYLRDAVDTNRFVGCMLTRDDMPRIKMFLTLSKNVLQSSITLIGFDHNVNAYRLLLAEGDSGFPLRRSDMASKEYVDTAISGVSVPDGVGEAMAEMDTRITDFENAMADFEAQINSLIKRINTLEISAGIK